MPGLRQFQAKPRGVAAARTVLQTRKRNQTVMADSNEREQITPGTKTMWLSAKSGGAKSIARDACGRFFCPPQPAGTVTVPVAWRSLCARTGTSVTMSKFYRWIRDRRISSIRVRGNYYIRVKTLDKLVEKAIRGIGW